MGELLGLVDLVKSFFVGQRSRIIVLRLLEDTFLIPILAILGDIFIKKLSEDEERVEKNYNKTVLLKGTVLQFFFFLKSGHHGAIDL